MLGLQINAPGNGIFERFAACTEYFDSLGIGAACEIAFRDGGELFKQTLFYKAVQERHFLGRLGQNMADDVFEHVLCQRHVVKKVGKGNFRLHHPELGGMAGRVALFSPEGGAKGINIAKRHTEGLHIELAADGQAGLLAKKVLRIVRLAVSGFGQIFQGQSRHLEHFARALTVAGGDDGGMHVYKASLGKKGV